MQGDIELLFTVLGGTSLSEGSGEEISKQLNGIVNELNKDPMRIKFAADEQSLKAIGEQLTAIKEGFNKIDLNFDVTSGLKTISEFLNSIGGSGIGNLTRTQESVIGINRELNRTHETIQGIASVSAGVDTAKVAQFRELLSANGIIDERMVERITNEFGNLNGVITSVNTNWREVGDHGNRVAAVTINAVDSVGNAFSRTIEFVRRADEEGKEYWDTQERGSAKIQVTVEKTAEKYDKLKRAISEYLKEAKSALKDKDIKSPDDLFSGDWEPKNEGVTKYAAKLTGMKNEALKARNALTALAESTSKQEEVEQILKNATDEYAVAQEKVNRQTADREAQALQTKIYNDAIKSIREYMSLVKQAANTSGLEAPTSLMDDSSESEIREAWSARNAGAVAYATRLNELRTILQQTVSSENIKLLSDKQQADILELLSKTEQEYAIAVERAEAAENKRQTHADQVEYYKELGDAIQRYNQLMSEGVKNKDITPPSSALGEWSATDNASANDQAFVTSLNEAAAKVRELTEARKDDARVVREHTQLEERFADAQSRAARAEEQRAEKSRETQRVNETAGRTLVQNEKLLQRYARAEKSSNAESRAAYANLQQAADKLRIAYANGQGDTEAIKKAQEEYNRVLRESEQVFIRNGDNVQRLSERLKNLVAQYGYAISTAQLIRTAWRYFKQMISSAIELESAFANLKIITNATDAEMAKFSETAIALSKNLGQSVTDVTKSIETFSRLGYTLEDASKLAEYATMMSNVAGVQNDEATTGLTAIIKGFNLDVNQAEHIADVLVEVGQKYAVSASEMMEAYEKSGAALNATNTSFEKSAGLIAAANASVQNAGVIGTALKTVSARIRGFVEASISGNRYAYATA